MAKKPKKEKTKKVKGTLFKVSEDKFEKKPKHCPKCGSGVYMAEHKDRYACGKCGFMEKK